VEEKRGKKTPPPLFFVFSLLYFLFAQYLFFGIK